MEEPRSVRVLLFNDEEHTFPNELVASFSNWPNEL